MYGSDSYGKWDKAALADQATASSATTGSYGSCPKLLASVSYESPFSDGPRYATSISRLADLRHAQSRDSVATFVTWHSQERREPLLWSVFMGVISVNQVYSSTSFSQVSATCTMARTQPHDNLEMGTCRRQIHSRSWHGMIRQAVVIVIIKPVEY